MGCGSSASTDSTSDLTKNPNTNSLLKKKSEKEIETSSTIITTSNNNKEDNVSGDEQRGQLGSRTTCRDSGIDSAKTSDGRRVQNNIENPQSSANNTGNPKGVAFDVNLEGSNHQDSIIKRHPPKRLLQKLDYEPPKLTAEMLAERQQLTEERRKKVIEGRAKSAKMTSRRRQDILAARDFSEKEMVEDNIKKINEKLSSADTKRAHAQEEIKAKQRQREARAKHARERAQQLNKAGTEELDYDIEKDEMFNNADADSWLDDGNNTEISKGSASSERIYNGRSSPVKKFHPQTSAERRKKQHSPNTDSDEEYNSVEDDEWASRSNGHKHNDDFFDT